MMMHTGESVIRINPGMIHSGPLVLVNAEHRLRLGMPCQNLAAVEHITPASTEESSMRLERTCLRQLRALIAACHAEKSIGIVSGYRTRMQQQRIYDKSYAENGAVFTASYVARPDESEHQTGLAVDVGELTTGVDYLCPSFPEHGVFADFRRLAADYGFIQRYKQGKEHLTHIACEPWHFRYVGVPHATIMEQYGMCLEEYTQYMQQFTPDGPHLFKKHKEYLIEMFLAEPEEEMEIKLRMQPGTHVEISGNNVNGCIIMMFHRHGAGNGL